MSRLNRRRRLLFAMLAAMDVAVSLPLVQAMLLGWSGLAPARRSVAGATLTAFAFFLLVWATMLLYLEMAERLKRRGTPSPRREIWMLLLILTATVVLTWLLVVWLEGSGATRPLSAFRSRDQGLAPWIVLLAYNGVLWWRVATHARRNLTFFGVGMTFRLGLLLALVACGLVSVFGAPAGTAQGLLYFWLYLGSGLFATALARIDDKAFVADHETGDAISWGRIARIAGATWLTVGAAAAVALAWSLDGFRLLFAAIAPLGRLLGWLATVAIAVLIWLLTPALLALEQMVANSFAPPTPPPPVSEAAQPWLTQMDDRSIQAAGNLSNAVTWLLIALVAALALALTWRFISRTMKMAGIEEGAPAIDPELGGPAPHAERRPWRLSLPWGRTPRGELLPSVSVPNLYANVTRLARRKGAARQPSQPPDDYLTTLQTTFPAHAQMLETLTDAYMSAHYGDHPASAEDLAALRAEFDHLRAEAE